MNQVTEQNSCETHVHCWVTEASTLGLKPGYWPTYLQTELGNKSPFRLISVDVECGNYRQDNGILDLVVFND